MRRVDTDALTYAAVVTRAQLAERRGRLPESRRLYEAALHRLPEAADRGDAPRLLRWIARTYRGDADHEITLDCAEAALAVADAQADASLAACAYDEALDLARRTGHAVAQLMILVHRAEGTLAEGDVDAAHFAVGQAMSLVGTARNRAARHDLLLLAAVTKELGELHCRQGRNRDALQCLDCARTLFARLRARHELAEVERRTQRLQEQFLVVAQRWSQSIECNDDYTQGHCERVANIACALAEADGMDAHALFWFRIGALLHDVGKLVVPAEVLNKRGRLTVEEWALVRSHPTAGAEMLAQVEFPWDVRPIVEAHHERWDGAGYPFGLAGEAIPRDARIVCIADVYDALTSARSYKTAMSHDDAMAVMRADAGTQFDPALFALFERVAATRAAEWKRGLTPSPSPEPARARARRRAAAPVARAGRPSRPLP